MNKEQIGGQKSKDLCFK